MRTNSNRLTLLAPGCFSALAHAQDAPIQQNRAQNTPEINDSKVLSTATQSYEQALAEVLHQPVPSLGQLPIAQHRFLFDTDKKAPQHCVCAELVHLQADKDNARLLPMQSLALSDDDSNQLIQALNDLIQADGMEVIRTKPNSYYLTGMDASHLDSWPAHAVANGKIANYLPRKSEAGDWRRLITEVQMLFYSHPVNQSRAANGQLPINAMWFWGGEQLHEYQTVNELQLIANDAFACGYGKSIGVPTLRADEFLWPQDTSEIKYSETVVVDLGVYSAWLCGDQDALLKAKKDLHDQWIAPAQNAVANGALAEFILDGCEGQAIVEKPKARSLGFSFKRFSLRNLFNKRRSS